MELIIIRGRQNDGKTTTATMLHNDLVARSTAVRLLKTNGDYLPVGNEVRDFRSVIDIKEKRIVIISAGDCDDVLNEEMEELIYQYRPDIMVVCARTQDRDGSAYRMLKDNYADLIKEENEFWTEWTDNRDDAISKKHSVVETIANRIMNI